MKAEEEQQVGKVISCRWQPRHEAHFESALGRDAQARSVSSFHWQKGHLGTRRASAGLTHCNERASLPPPCPYVRTYPGQKAAISQSALSCSLS